MDLRTCLLTRLCGFWTINNFKIHARFWRVTATNYGNERVELFSPWSRTEFPFGAFPTMWELGRLLVKIKKHPLFEDDYIWRLVLFYPCRSNLSPLVILNTMFRILCSVFGYSPLEVGNCNFIIRMPFLDQICVYM